MVRRQIYGGQPSDDAEITVGLVNVWLDSAIAIAAKTNYTDSVKLDGIAYINGGFYTTYKGLSVSTDDMFLYKIVLPHIPYGLGENESVSTIIFKGNSAQFSQPVIWITQNQKSFFQNMRPIPNKLLGYMESQFIYVISTVLLNQYTATVCMVSGGDATNLDSTLNVPSDYHEVMIEYLKKQLIFERNIPQDVTNDGSDIINTT
jgi:hypothetical protein